MVYYLFVIFPPRWTIIFRFPLIQGNSVRAKITQNTVTKLLDKWFDYLPID